ncbi:putative membrane protein [Novosphingobium chloroacetimidivorans]|uniref:Putative membrane protein n=1 Tax=Novosphingobium chloroacetimidivorans TaxID=1428314 RepID=A0A7W7KA28_9SPHN|nr:glycosyltransferase family 87 protein [Novosphingobium chloroacetimidivorans]MBB4858986.1 putative membrane protein [Novosphingobium chloroacetimidivorans]
MDGSRADRHARWVRAWPLLLGALGLLLVLHHLAEFAQVLREGVGQASLTLDFRTYMCGSADLIRPYDICHNDEFVSGFVYPPPSILYFHALSRLPIQTAFLIHSGIVALCLAAACAMIVALLPEGRRHSWTAIVMGLGIAPIGTCLAAGQVNVLLMVSAVAGVWFASRQMPGRAGVAIALGFWLKIYPALVPALFLTRAKLPAAVATVLWTIAIGLAGLLWAAPELYRQYFVELLPHAQGYTMPGVAYSIAGAAAYIAAGGGAPVQHFVPIPEAVQWLSKAVLGAGILAAMAHQRLTQDSRPLDSLNVLLCASLIAAPNAWGYHYAMILPAIVAALAREFARPTWALPLVLGCWLALVVPGWTDPPGLIASQPLLNVPFRERYALAAAVLLVLTMLQLMPVRPAARSRQERS